MEILEYPSAWLCSHGPRLLTYQILSASSQQQIVSVKEYDRIVKKLVPRQIPIATQKDEHLSLESLYAQTEEHRLQLFYKALGITDFQLGVVDPASSARRDNDVLTAMIICWLVNSEPHCNKM